MLQVYCWRGGNRSASLAHVLSQIGFNVAVLSRGYNGYRKQVTATASSGRVEIPSTRLPSPRLTNAAFFSTSTQPRVSYRGNAWPGLLLDTAYAAVNLKH